MKVTTDAYPFPLGSKPEFVHADGTVAIKLSNGDTFYLTEPEPGRLHVLSYGTLHLVPGGGVNVVNIEKHDK